MTGRGCQERAAEHDTWGLLRPKLLGRLEGEATPWVVWTVTARGSRASR
jgi:hypothetical protein